MNDVIPCFIVIVLCTIVIAPLIARAAASERRFLAGAFALHMVFALALYWIMESVFKATDVHMYLYWAQDVGARLSADPVRWAPQLVLFICRLPSDVPLEPGATSHMVAVTALGMWATGSMPAIMLGSAFVSFLGKWALYTAMRDELASSVSRRALLIATLFIPSCVFWTSGLVKEAFALAGIGFLLRGAQLLLRKRSPASFLYLAPGVVLVAGFKPHFLFPFVIATALWVVLPRARKSTLLTPVLLIVGGALAMVGFVVLGSVFQEYSVERLADTVADHQLYGTQAEGGSNFTMGDAEAHTVGGQLSHVPLALATALFRPLPFEVHNTTSLIAMLEISVLTILLIHAVVRRGPMHVVRTTFQMPMALFAVVFLFCSAIGVGLATTNFGTLSRYRTPLLPFYGVVIAILRAAPSSVPSPVPASSPQRKSLRPAVRRRPAPRKPTLAR